MHNIFLCLLSSQNLKKLLAWLLPERKTFHLFIVNNPIQQDSSFSFRDHILQAIYLSILFQKIVLLKARESMGDLFNFSNVDDKLLVTPAFKIFMLILLTHYVKF